MKALILRNSAETAAQSAQALMQKGFQVMCVETREAAHAMIRIETIDLLVMEERVEQRLTHALALSAERRNPYISTILMTDRGAAETDDLYDLIPCLYALAGTAISPQLLGQLALSSVENFDEAEARVGRHAKAGAAEDTADDDFDIDLEQIEEQLAAQQIDPDPSDDELETDHPLGDDLVAALREMIATDESEIAVAAVEEDIPYYADVAEMTSELCDSSYNAEDLVNASHANEAELPHSDDEVTLGHPLVGHIAHVSIIGDARSFAS